MTYMIDTNICIYAIKNKPEQVFSRLTEMLDRGVCISSVTLAELVYGVAKSDFPKKNTTSLIQFLALINVLPFDDSAAVEYGRIRAYLEKQGTPIGKMDMLIASHAKSEKLIMVTNNVREFERIPGLTIENWV